MIELINQIVNISKTAANDPMLRPAVSAVCIDRSENGLRLRATNGFALAEIYTQDFGLELDKPILIPLIEIKKLKKWAVANKKEKISCELDEKTLTFNSPSGAIKLELSEFEYPGTDRAKPSEREEVSYTLNPKLLHDLCEAMRSCKYENGATLTFAKDGPLEVIKVEFNGAHGLLMPMRGDK